MPKRDLAAAHRPWLPTFPTETGETICRYDLRETATERIIAAWRVAHRIWQDAEASNSRDVWSPGLDGQFASLRQILEEADAEALISYLKELPRQSAGHGFYQGELTYQTTLCDAEFRQTRVQQYLDQVVSFAEAVGLLPLRCVEQGPWEEPPVSDLGDFVRSLERHVGMTLALPDVAAGMVGLSVEGRIVHLRSISAAYLIWRVRQIGEQLLRIPIDRLRLCEIGPGAGLSAICADQAGVRSITLIDLPIMNVIQAYVLMSVLPDRRYILCGEADDLDPTAIRIRPTFEFGTIPVSFDLVANQDSFPELSRNKVLGYLERIGAQKQLLLSINQEAQAPQYEGVRQHRVSELVDAAGGFRKLYRFQNWVRRGYVEELFAPS